MYTTLENGTRITGNNKKIKKLEYQNIGKI